MQARRCAAHTRRTRARAARIASAQSSKFHRDVSSALIAMGVGHDNEHDIKGLVVDIAVGVRGVADGQGGGVVVEADGPSHFFRNLPGRPTGATLSKRRLLRSLGWEVVSVPYFEWRVLRGKQEQMDYLSAKPGLGGAGRGDAECPRES